MTAVAHLVDYVEQKTATVEPRRVLIGAVTIPFWLAGAAVGFVVRALFVAGVWAWAGLTLGYQTGRGARH
jgi:hypothetical protein